jgi:hypothetical protein
VMAYAFRRREEIKAFFHQPVFPLLAVTFCFFLLVNFYRFSRNWGDSNKFIMFLNFWLSLIFGQMVTVLLATRRLVGKIIALVALSLAVGPYLFHLRIDLRGSPSELFSKADALAALWVTQHTESDDVFVNSPLTVVDFIPALAGRGVLHGMYVTTLPYYDPRLPSEIQRLYENADFGVLRAHSVQYVRVSDIERRQYHINPIFDQPDGLVYSGETRNFNSIRIYSAKALLESADFGHTARYR